jgi:hypothetical protein
LYEQTMAALTAALAAVAAVLRGAGDRINVNQ